VFFAVGPGVAPGTRLDAVGLLDVAPTVLAALGLPASVQMTGHAAIFSELPRVESWDQLVPGLTWLGGSAGVNDEQLKALGYVE